MMQALRCALLASVTFAGLAARAAEPARAEPELTAAEVRALASEPDDRRDVPEPLKVYPMAREYDVSVRYQAAGQPPADAPKTVARERLVRGKYLIATVRPPGVPADVIMLVYFNGVDATYRKLVLRPRRCPPQFRWRPRRRLSDDQLGDAPAGGGRGPGARAITGDPLRRRNTLA